MGSIDHRYHSNQAMVAGWRLKPALALILIALGATVSAGPAHSATTEIPHLSAHLDVNAVDMLVTNVGSLASDVEKGGPGLEWPIGAGKHVVGGAGLWLGATVGGEVRIAMTDDTWEFAAGPLDAAGQPVDPTESNPDWRVLKVDTGSDSTGADYVLWKALARDLESKGPPVTANGQPLIRGDQALWCVFNDAVAAGHTHPAGATAPLGVEVRQYVWGSFTTGAMMSTAFVEFEIDNRGPNVLEDLWIGLWIDAALGDRADDLVGIDTDLNLAFAYNGGDDAEFGTAVPAVGCKLLRGPDTPGGELGIASFSAFGPSGGPQNAQETYRMLQGLTPAGEPQLCDGAPTSLPLNGNPVTGTGCLDGPPGDRRMLAATGPLTMAPGDVQRIAIAFVVGGSPGTGDPLSNVDLMRFNTHVIQERFDQSHLPAAPVCLIAPYLEGFAGESIQFDGSRSYDPDGTIVGFDWEFGDGASGSGPEIVHVYTSPGQFDATLTITDNDGLSSSCTAEVSISTVPPPAPVTFINLLAGGSGGAEYENVNVLHERAWSWVDWGGPFFHGGVGLGCDFSGSAIVPSETALASCPEAIVAPERFATVELRFEGRQRGYRYLRKELPTGGAPATGRAYNFVGYDDVMCTAWKLGVGEPMQLQVMYTERAYADDAGTLSPTQPASQDALFQPTTEEDGGREYLLILDVPYSETPDSEFMQDDIYFSGQLPVLYGVWVRHRGESNSGPEYVIDPEDRFVIHWPDVGAPVAWGVAAFVDFTGDGTDDLVRTSLDANKTYANATTSLTAGWFDHEAPALSTASPTLTQSWADYDGDGDWDVFLGNQGNPNQLLANDGGGQLTAVEMASIGTAGDVEAAAWFDLENDGDLDLLLASPHHPNRLLVQDESGALLQGDHAALESHQTTHVSALDVSGDGWVDLYLTGTVRNALYHYEDGVGLVEATPNALALGALGGASAWADYDADGDWDVFQFAPEGQSQLLRNDGEVFSAVDTEVVPAGVQAAAWADFNNDRRLDLFLGRNAAAVLLRGNAGDGSFFSITLPQEFAGIHSLALADVNQNGGVDVFGLRATRSNLLLEAEDRGNSWLEIDLQGRASNSKGIGALVTITRDTTRQHAQMVQSNHSPALHFGTYADRVEVQWPSGTRQAHDGSGQRRIAIEEAPISEVQLEHVDLTTIVQSIHLRSIRLSWIAQSSPHLLGFHVWRSVAGTRERTRLTEDPLTSQFEYEYTDANLLLSENYDYWIEAVGEDQASQFFGPLRRARALPPRAVALYPARPNPFNPGTTIRFDLPARGSARLVVHDVAGRVVRVLLDDVRDAGVHSVRWNGRETRGVPAGSGVYFYRLEAGGRTLTGRMALVR